MRPEFRHRAGSAALERLAFDGRRRAARPGALDPEVLGGCVGKEMSRLVGKPPSSGSSGAVGPTAWG